MRRSIILISLALIALSFNAKTAPAQPGPPDSLWMKTFGEDGDDFGAGICVAYDNGFIITGSSTSYGAGLEDLFFAKVDENGDSIWFKNYGGPYVDSGYCICKSNDGGYIVVGEFQPQLGVHKYIYVIKIDDSGDTLWTETYYIRGYDIGRSIQQTSDSGYIMTGLSGSPSDLILMKIDSVGNQEWIRFYGGSTPDRGDCVRQTPDGGYIVVGDVNYEFYLLKTDSLGYEEWSRRIFDASGNSVDLTYDGGYIVSGWMDETVLMIKYDSLGNEIWTYNHIGILNGGGACVRETQDHGFITCGICDTPTNDYQMYLLKTDIFGQFEWEVNFGGPENDKARELAITSEGNFGLVGNHVGDIALLYVGFPSGIFSPKNTNNFIYDLSVYPNPFNSSFKLELPFPITTETQFSIYSSNGRKINPEISLRQNSYLIDFSKISVSSGVYFYRIQNSNQTSSGKVFYLK